MWSDSAIPALQKCNTPGAHSITGARGKFGEEISVGGGRRELTRQIGTVSRGKTTCENIRVTAANIGTDHWLIEPIRRGPVAQVCVQNRPSVVGAISLAGIIGLGERDEPVPVQKRDILVRCWPRDAT